MSLAPPNHTQTPNELLDEVLPQIDSLAELKVTLAIVRQTFGWHRGDKVLSITRLMALTGLSRQGVLDGTAKAVDRGYVARTERGQSYAYSLSVASQRSRPAGVSDSDGQTALEGVNDSDPEKERGKSTAKKTTSAGADDDRAEAKRLSELLGLRCVQRTGRESYRAAAETEGWITAMDRLMRIDGRSPELIERAIEWVHTHEFWSTNVLSAPTLRKQFDKLVLQAERDRKPQSGARRSSGTIASIRREDDTPYGSTVERAQPYADNDNATATGTDDA